MAPQFVVAQFDSIYTQLPRVPCEIKRVHALKVACLSVDPQKALQLGFANQHSQIAFAAFGFTSGRRNSLAGFAKLSKSGQVIPFIERNCAANCRRLSLYWRDFNLADRRRHQKSGRNMIVLLPDHSPQATCLLLVMAMLRRFCAAAFQSTPLNWNTECLHQKPINCDKLHEAVYVLCVSPAHFCPSASRDKKDGRIPSTEIPSRIPANLTVGIFIPILSISNRPFIIK